MRLSPSQAAVIVSVIQGISSDAEVYLYGSRVRDDLKGGDIDILVVANDVSLLQAKQFYILNEIKKSSDVGDRRIDIKYCTPSELKEDPFLRGISQEMARIIN